MFRKSNAVVQELMQETTNPTTIFGESQDSFQIRIDTSLLNNNDFSDVSNSQSDCIQTNHQDYHNCNFNKTIEGCIVTTDKNSNIQSKYCPFEKKIQDYTISCDIVDFDQFQKAIQNNQDYSGFNNPLINNKIIEQGQFEQNISYCFRDNQNQIIEDQEGSSLQQDSQFSLQDPVNQLYKSLSEPLGHPINYQDEIQVKTEHQETISNQECKDSIYHHSNTISNNSSPISGEKQIANNYSNGQMFPKGDSYSKIFKVEKISFQSRTPSCKQQSQIQGDDVSEIQCQVSKIDINNFTSSENLIQNFNQPLNENGQKRLKPNGIKKMKKVYSGAWWKKEYARKDRKYYICPLCARKFKKPQCLGGHVSRGHPNGNQRLNDFTPSNRRNNLRMFGQNRVQSGRGQEGDIAKEILIQNQETQEDSDVRDESHMC